MSGSCRFLGSWSLRLKQELGGRSACLSESKSPLPTVGPWRSAPESRGWPRLSLTFRTACLFSAQPALR